MDHITRSALHHLLSTRNIGFYITKLQVVACIQHTAVSISRPLAEIICVSSAAAMNITDSLEMLCKKGSQSRSSFQDIHRVRYSLLLISSEHGPYGSPLYDTDRTYLHRISLCSFCKLFLPCLRKRLSGKQSLLTATIPICFWHVVLKNLHSHISRFSTGDIIVRLYILHPKSSSVMFSPLQSVECAPSIFASRQAINHLFLAVIRPSASSDIGKSNLCVGSFRKNNYTEIHSHSHGRCIVVGVGINLDPGSAGTRNASTFEVSYVSPLHISADVR